jgi:hypothetical protein
VSRDWILYLDDLIAGAEKIGRRIAGRELQNLLDDEAAYDAVLFNLLIVGESIKRLPTNAGPICRRRNGWDPRGCAISLPTATSRSSQASSGTSPRIIFRCCWTPRDSFAASTTRTKIDRPAGVSRTSQHRARLQPSW